MNEEKIQDQLRWIYDHPDVVLAADTETTGLRVAGNRDHVIGASLAMRIGENIRSMYVPLAHPAGGNVSRHTADQLRYVLAKQPRRLVFANVQFDIIGLENIGIPTAHQDIYDVITMAHLIDENQPINKSLDSLARHYKIGQRKVVDERVEAEKKSGNATITPDEMEHYARIDTEVTLRLYEYLIAHPEWLSLPNGLWAHKQQLVRVLLSMKRRGVRIDRDLVVREIDKAEIHMRAAKQAMGLNPKEPLGPKHLERLIHTETGIPILHRTPAGKPRFDKVAMADYDELLDQAQLPIARELKRFRGWQKTSSAAYIPYLSLTDSDGRLRCGYKLHGTTTGRLSCSEPNLQQIPKTTDKPWNGRVKEAFIADPGYTLVNADYSQLELRLATAYAPDTSLVRTFAEGRDIFTEMTAQLAPMMGDDWDRNKTKTLVYSMQYGAGDKRVMQAFHVSKDRAQMIRRNYASTYPLFKMLTTKCTQDAESQGYVKMWSGRKRRFQYASDGYKAMNAMIQGGAADIVERTMVRLFNELDSDNCRMLLQVHDSVTFEIRSDLVADYLPRIRAIMEDVDTVMGMSTGVRFAVDIGPWSSIEAAKWPKELVAA